MNDSLEQNKRGRLTRVRFGQTGPCPAKRRAPHPKYTLESEPSSSLRYLTIGFPPAPTQYEVHCPLNLISSFAYRSRSRLRPWGRPCAAQFTTLRDLRRHQAEVYGGASSALVKRSHSIVYTIPSCHLPVQCLRGARSPRLPG